MLLKNANELRPELETFCRKTKMAVLVETGGLITENGDQPIIVHFFGDSQSILAKSIALAGIMLPSDKSLGLPTSKFYVLSADDMDDAEITALLKSSENDKRAWFNEKRALSDGLLLNNILFEK